MNHPDPAFPHLHGGRPDRGWLNDPNGCAYLDGRYHVFFQYNPDVPAHDRIGWGHVSSTDLVHWEAEPMALVPQPDGPDAFGCWSGCLVVDDGVPTAVYSGVRADGGVADALLARGSADLKHWKQGDEPAVARPDDPAVTQVRDPFVVTIEGRRYAVQGAGSVTGPPQVLVYDCTDLTRWTPLGALLDGTDPVAAGIAPAEVWECPNLALIDGRWVLLVSLWRYTGPGCPPDLAGARYLVGDVEVGDDGPRFTPESGGPLDLGDCFYAPQLLVTDERVLVWGWAKENARPPEDVEAAGWAGVLTHPRELAVRDGRLVGRLVPELAGLRVGARVPVQSDDALPFPAFEVEVAPGAGRVQLVLTDGSDERLVASWSADLHSSTRALVDGSIVEIEDGRGIPRTVRAYPAPGDRWRLRFGSQLQAHTWPLAAPA